MRYITDVENSVSWTDKSVIGNWITEYSYEKNDYFMNYRIMWNEVSGDMYVYRIGKDIIEIPTTFNIMIGDVYGNVDWIPVEELMNRNLDIVVLDTEFRNVSIQNATYITTKKGSVYWPSTPNVIPMQVGDKVVVLTEKDVYAKSVGTTMYDMVM